MSQLNISINTSNLKELLKAMLVLSFLTVKQFKSGTKDTERNDRGAYCLFTSSYLVKAD